MKKYVHSIKKKKKKQPGVVLHWQIEADLGQNGGYSGKQFLSGKLDIG